MKIFFSRFFRPEFVNNIVIVVRSVCLFCKYYHRQSSIYIITHLGNIYSRVLWSVFLTDLIRRGPMQTVSPTRSPIVLIHLCIHLFIYTGTDYIKRKRRAIDLIRGGRICDRYSCFQKQNKKFKCKATANDCLYVQMSRQ